jgi:hypothetical protein
VAGSLAASAAVAGGSSPAGTAAAIGSSQGPVSGAGWSPTSVLASPPGSPSFLGLQSHRLLHHYPSTEIAQHTNIY